MPLWHAVIYNRENCFFLGGYVALNFDCFIEQMLPLYPTTGYSCIALSRQWTIYMISIPFHNSILKGAVTLILLRLQYKSNNNLNTVCMTSLQCLHFIFHVFKFTFCGFHWKKVNSRIKISTHTTILMNIFHSYLIPGLASTSISKSPRKVSETVTAVFFNRPDALPDSDPWSINHWSWK